MGLLVTAVVNIGLPLAQEPPETTGAGAGADEDGACDGCWRLLPLLDVLEELEDCDDCVEVVAALAVLWPWNERAAATETAPVRTTAPATHQRLIRRISSRPASLALIAFLFTSAMVGAGCKKTLKQV